MPCPQLSDIQKDRERNVGNSFQRELSDQCKIRNNFLNVFVSGKKLENYTCNNICILEHTESTLYTCQVCFFWSVGTVVAILQLQYVCILYACVKIRVYVCSNGSKVGLTGCTNSQEVKMLFLEGLEF